jgi:hypothetical protein
VVLECAYVFESAWPSLGFLPPPSQETTFLSPSLGEGFLQDTNGFIASLLVSSNHNNSGEDEEGRENGSEARVLGRFSKGGIESS